MKKCLKKQAVGVLGALLLVFFVGCGNNDSRTEIIVVRHGQTDWNVIKRTQGHTNVPLNAVGIKQAEVVADYLANNYMAPNIVAIYSSTLSRAYTTAHIIAEKIGAPVYQDVRLCGYRKGIFQGLTRAEIKEQFPDIAHQKVYDDSGQIPGAERRVEMEKRVSDALREIAEKHHGKRVVVVSHGGPLRAMYHWIKGEKNDRTLPYKKMKNAAIGIISVVNDVWKVDEWANDEHLKVLEPRPDVVQQLEREMAE